MTATRPPTGTPSSIQPGGLGAGVRRHLAVGEFAQTRRGLIGLVDDGDPVGIDLLGAVEEVANGQRVVHGSTSGVRPTREALQPRCGSAGQYRFCLLAGALGSALGRLAWRRRASALTFALASARACSPVIGDSFSAASVTRLSPTPNIHTSLAIAMPCWVGRGLPSWCMPGVRHHMPSSAPLKPVSADAGQPGRDDRGEQRAAEGDLADRQRLEERSSAAPSPGPGTRRRPCRATPWPCRRRRRACPARNSG